MDLDAVAWQALIAWLLFPALGLPTALVARRLGHPGFLRRLAVWLLVIPTVLVASYAGPAWFTALLAAACGIACAEVAALTDGGRRELRCLAALAGAAPPLVAAWSVGQPAWPWLLATLAAAAVVFRTRVVRSPVFDAAAVGGGMGAGLAFWILLQTLPEGFRFVLFAFSVVAVSDIMAFFAGRFIGGPHPFPRLSPHKTVGGYAGTIVIAMLAAWILSFTMPEFGLARLTLAGVVIAVAGASGDLAASGVKRRYGVKDSGWILGPIGGMLDRLDSLVGAGWAFYLFRLI